MWDECITLYVRNCLLCWQHDSINNQYKAKGKNKGFEEELTISPHLHHHHHHNHLAGRDFEEVWPGVRLLLGSTPSARPRCSKCSTLSTLLAVASLSLSLFWSKHHQHKNGQGSHSDTTSFGESHHTLAFNLFPRHENKEKCPAKSIFPVKSR